VPPRNRVAREEIGYLNSVENPEDEALASAAGCTIHDTPRDTTVVTNEDIVERIRKLLRLAEDAGATEAEAAAALERANALLIRHNLSMDAIAVSTGEQPAVGERHIHAGWAGSWRGSLLGILARHNFCSPFISRQGKRDTVIVVGRPANVDATHAMYDWITDQLERIASEEWLLVNRVQRENRMSGKVWCPDCEDWPAATYRELGRLHCSRCDTRVLPTRPVVHGFSWKTAFYRGAVSRIYSRLQEQRKAAQADAPVTALMLRTEQENADWIRKQHGELRTGKSRRRRYLANALERGQHRGDEVTLAPQPRLTGGTAHA